MEDKNHSTNEFDVSDDDSTTASEAARLDAIIDFYKDKPIPEDDNGDITTADESDTNHVSDFIKRIFKSKGSDKPVISSADNDEDIHTGAYGLNPKHRQLTLHAVTTIICITIIAGSYLLALLVPGDTEIINNYADTLRKDNEYISLSNRYRSLSHEVAELKTANEAKKSKIDSISDYDNTKAALRSEISKKAEELSLLNTQITEKRALIDVLNENIAQKASPVITLNAGKYVIGTNIAAGKYYITGSGTFSAASSDNISKYNISLGNAGHEVMLEKGDIIKINSTTRFTSAN